jgi:hypothetical protein
MHTAFALAAATIALASAPAPLTCFDASVYAGVRTSLSELPDERQRAALDDEKLAAAYGELEMAGHNVLATEGSPKCDEAKRALARYNTIRDFVVDAGGLDAGYCCTNWNTSTGGTGCTATTGTSCDGGLFFCEKKSDGTCF